MGLFFRRGQAALEFLTTYGWAVLVLLVMVASLSNFGVLSPDRFLPNRCSASSEFSCNEFELFANGYLRVILNNQVGQDVNFFELVSVQVGSGIYNSSQLNCDFFNSNGVALDGSNGVVRSGQAVNMVCKVPDEFIGSVGGKQGVDFDLAYRRLGASLSSPLNLGIYTSIQEVGLDTGLIGHWHLDDLSISDSSRYGRQGVTSDVILGSGAFSNNLLFNGVDSYVRVQEVSDAVNSYTASAWIHPLTISASSLGDSIISDDDGVGSSYSLWLTVMDSGELNLRSFRDDTMGSITSGAEITESSWHHVAVSAIRGGESRVYVDGELIHTFINDGNGYSWFGDFYVGELRANRELAFDGYIENVRVYNYPLDDLSVLEIYEQGR